MSTELTKFCNEQYNEFLTELETRWGVEKPALTSLNAQLKGSFQQYLALATLCGCLADGGQRKSYVCAIPEAACLSLILTVKGLETPASTLMRQCIELAFKHVYFASHPIEYSWISSREGYKEINFQFLIAFVRRCEEFERFPDSVALLKDLEEYFHVFSRYVHVHSHEFISFSRFSHSDPVSSPKLKRSLESWRKVVPSLILLMVLFFPQVYLAASDIEKKLIKKTLDAELRSKLNVYLEQMAEDEFVPLGPLVTVEGQM